jgi:hypothetical protein
MTDYHYRVLLICANKDAGNALANLAAAYPSDPGAELGTFVDVRSLSPSGWYAEIPAKSTMAGVIQALADRAPYSDERLAYLIERGLTTEQWAVADAIFPAVEVYDTLVGGYRPTAMADLAAANGYTIMEPIE